MLLLAYALALSHTSRQVWLSRAVALVKLVCAHSCLCRSVVRAFRFAALHGI